MVLEAATQGLAGFEGPRLAIGQFIRSKLEEAKQKGLLQFQGDIQTQGALNIAQLKGDIEGADTKQGGLVSPTGEITPITGGTGEGGRDFPSDFKFITPREGRSADEQAFEDAKFRLKTQALEGAGGGGANVIEQGGAKGTATPVSSVVKAQAPEVEQGGNLSQEERELLEALQALGG